jgi:uncharacterized protein
VAVPGVRWWRKARRAQGGPHFRHPVPDFLIMGRREGVLEQDATVIGLAAALHNIEIKKAEEKYHSTAGKYQEIEGLPTCQANSAKKRHYGINERIIERACFLIG